MSDTAFCGACGTGIEADSKFCPACGARQQEFQAPAPPPAEEPPTERMDSGPRSPEPKGDEPAVPPIAEPPPAVADAPTQPAAPAFESPEAGGGADAETRAAQPQSPLSPPPTPPAVGARPPAAPPPQAQAPQPPPQEQTLPPPPQPPPPPHAQPPRSSHGGEGRAEQFAQRVETLDPDAGDFAKQLAAGFQAPGVLTALLGGLLAALGCFAVGLLLALALPDESIIGALGSVSDTGVVTEAFGQTVGLLLAKFEGERVIPMLLVLVPIAACAAATFSQAGRTRSMAPRTRMLCAAAVGFPFGLLMLIAAVATGDLDASAGGAFLLGLLWGSVGGAAGMAFAMRREAPEMVGTSDLPPQVKLASRLLAAALKPLAALLVVTALIGTGAWWLASFRDHDSARFDRSLPVSLVENTLFAGEHAVNYAALGAGVQFTTDEGAPPVPVNNENAFDIESELRLFDLGDDIEAYFFVPLLVFLIALPLLLALYAGFATARASGARKPELAAAWGALVGPVWAVALGLLSAMQVKLLGHPEGGSLFGIFLLGGAVLGALGGLLSTQGARSGSTDSTPNA